MRWRPPMTRESIALLVVLSACSVDEYADFSVATTRPIVVNESFRRQGPSYRLRRVMTLGSAEGSDSEILGAVMDAAFGPERSVYVADAGLKRVVVFDSVGTFLRSFGRSGQGPGEFVAPSSITLSGDTVFVYDSRQGRISALSSSGDFYRFVSPPSVWAQRLRSTRRNTLLLTIAADEHVVAEITTTGEKIRDHVPRPAIEATMSPEDVPEPGRVCVAGGDFVYANPWRYELVRIDLATGVERWTRQYPSDVLRPVLRDEDGASRAARGGGLLGLACTESLIVLAYIDLQSGTIRYDLLAPTGEPRGRLEYRREREEDYPGFIVDMTGDKLLAFRSRPFPQVSVWVIERVSIE